MANLPVGIIVLIILLLAVIVGLILFAVRELTKPRMLQSIKKDIEVGNYNIAIKRLQQIIQKDSFNYDAHFLLAQAYEAAGNNKMAIMEYRIAEKSIENKPVAYEINLRTKLAALLENNGEEKEALEEYLLLLKADPKQKTIHYKVGSIYSKNNKQDKALSHLTMAVKIDPQYQDAYRELGICHYELGQFKEALDDFTYAVRYDNRDYISFFHMGLIYRHFQDYSKALECFDASSRESSLKLKSVLNRGLCFLNMGNYRRVIDELSKGVKMITNSNETTALHMRYFLAEAFEQNRDVLSAIEQWEAIIKANPKFKDVAAKLEQYHDLRQSDYLKDYVTASITDFQDICAEIVQHQEMGVHELKVVNNDEVWITGRESSKMVGKMMLILIVFNRSSGNTTEEKLRGMFEEMKGMNCHKALYYTNGQFTTQASEYSNTRPIDLFGASKLNELLQDMKSA